MSIGNWGSSYSVLWFAFALNLDLLMEGKKNLPLLFLLPHLD